jgi:hypothetical protein
MKYKPLLFGVIAPLLILLMFYLASVSPKVYVLDFGAGAAKQVSCDEFLYQPILNTVYCDGVSYFGVRDVGVK